MKAILLLLIAQYVYNISAQVGEPYCGVVPTGITPGAPTFFGTSPVSCGPYPLEGGGYYMFNFNFCFPEVGSGNTNWQFADECGILAFATIVQISAGGQNTEQCIQSYDVWLSGDILDPWYIGQTPPGGGSYNPVPAPCGPFHLVLANRMTSALNQGVVNPVTSQGGILDVFINYVPSTGSAHNEIEPIVMCPAIGVVPTPPSYNTRSSITLTWGNPTPGMMTYCTN